MPWVDDDNGFDYRLLKSGALEFRDRQGRYQLVWGCNASGWHEFWERLGLIRDCLGVAPPEMTLEAFYLEHGEFRRHCDRCLELSGIDPETVSPTLMRWLLFPANTESEAPLVALNTPYPQKHPTLLGGGEGISGRVEFLAALASVCEGSLADAVELANSTPARDVMVAMESKAWGMASQEDKDKALLSEEKRKSGAMMAGRKTRRKKGVSDG